MAMSVEEKKIRNRENAARWRERHPEKSREHSKRYYESKGRIKKAEAAAKLKAFMDDWYPKKTEDQGYCESLRAEPDIADLLA